MSRSATLAAALACGAAGAALYLSLFTGAAAAAILVSLSQLPLFGAGLWLGPGAAVVAATAATAIVLAIAGEAAVALFFAAFYAVPVVLLVRLALLARTDGKGGIEWYQPGPLTAWLTALALAAFAVAIAWFGGPQPLQSALRLALAPAVSELVETSAAGRLALTDFLSRIVPGILAASWMLLVITNGVLAQGVLSRFGANWRPSPQIAALCLPLWMTLALGAAALATLFAGPARFVGVNALIVLAVPFCLGGLAVVHAVAGRLARPAVPLITFYVVAGLFGWPFLLVALLGLFDAPFGLRQRLAPSPSLGGK